jgi:NTP pyrophosphatase (non-canonical NTP hydrolase)
MRELRLNDYAKYITYHREKKGFVTSWDNMLEKLMLVVSECSEAAEAFRVNDREHFNEEIADTFIRLLDICGALNIDIEKAIEDKMAINVTRPQQHGKVLGDVKRK